MSYSWKTLQELGWAIAVAIIVYLGTAFSGLNISDWHVWLPVVLAGAGRAAIAAIVAFISPSGTFAVK